MRIRKRQPREWVKPANPVVEAERRRVRAETHRGNAAAPQRDAYRENKRPGKRSRGASVRRAIQEYR